MFTFLLLIIIACLVIGLVCWAVLLRAIFRIAFLRDSPSTNDCLDCGFGTWEQKPGTPLTCPKCGSGRVHTKTWLTLVEVVEDQLLEEEPMFSDVMKQGDGLAVVLNCGFCGVPARKGHTCPGKTEAEKQLGERQWQNEQEQPKNSET